MAANWASWILLTGKGFCQWFMQRMLKVELLIHTINPQAFCDIFLDFFWILGKQRPECNQTTFLAGAKHTCKESCAFDTSPTTCKRGPWNPTKFFIPLIPYPYIIIVELCIWERTSVSHQHWNISRAQVLLANTQTFLSFFLMYLWEKKQGVTLGKAYILIKKVISQLSH